jgi:hydrogenase maturation protease
MWNLSIKPIRQSKNPPVLLSGRQVDFYIVGLGSWLSSDDEIGLALVSALAEGEAFHDRCVLLENSDATVVASTLIEWDRPVILVDAADMRLAPGMFRFFSDNDAAMIIKSSSVSTHGLGLAEGLGIARALGYDQPVLIFGIQPFDLSPRQGLTPEMNARFPLLIEALRKECSSDGPFQKDRKRPLLH